MEFYIDNMVRFLSSDLPIDKLRKIRDVDLTCFYPDGTRLRLYEEEDGIMSIPRAYYLCNMWSPSHKLHDFTTFPIDHDFPEFKGSLRDGQQKAMENMFSQFGQLRTKHGGRIKARCGAGKTCVAIYSACRLKTPTIVLLHKSDLIDQWKEEIEQFVPGAKVGVVKQDKYEVAGMDFVLASFGTLYSRTDELEKKGLFKSFGMVVVDEAHHVTAKTFEAVTKKFHSRIRLGLSATWKRKDDMDLIYQHHLGDQLVEMKGEVVTGKFVQISYGNDIPEKKVKVGRDINFGKLTTFISKDPARNAWLCNEIIKAHDSGRTTLVLSGRMDQIDFLAEAIRKRLMKRDGHASVGKYTGKQKKAELEESAKCKIIIGTYGLFAEGTSIKALDCLFFATPMSDVEQAVGRIQRICTGKKEPLVIDPVDKISICYAMANKRRKVYDRIGFKNQRGGK